MSMRSTLHGSALALAILLQGCGPGKLRIEVKSEPMPAHLDAACLEQCAKVDDKGMAVIDWLPWLDGTATQLYHVSEKNKGIASALLGACEARRLLCANALRRLIDEKVITP